MRTHHHRTNSRDKVCDRFDDLIDESNLCTSTGESSSGANENATFGSEGFVNSGVGSTLRRSQRQAAQRLSAMATSNEDSAGEDQKDPQKESYVQKGRKSLFPLFYSLKRTVTQAISPEGKSQTEPSSKKSY